MGALVRESFDIELWEERKVHDTPHGFFAKMMGREAARVNRDVNTGCTRKNGKRGERALSLRPVATVVVILLALIKIISVSCCSHSYQRGIRGD